MISMFSFSSFSKGGVFDYLTSFAIPFMPSYLSSEVSPLVEPSEMPTEAPPSLPVKVDTIASPTPVNPATQATVQALEPLDLLPKRIQKELDKLRIYAINSTLGNLILHMICGLPNDPKNPLVTSLFHEGNNQRTPIQFKEALERLINSRKDISSTKKIVAKLACSLLFIITKAYLNSLFRSLEPALLNFVALPPEKQVERMYELCLTPMSNYFQDVEYAYSDRAKKYKDLDKALEGRQYNAVFFDDCLKLFVERFLNSHISALGRRWTDKRVQNFNETDEKTNSTFQKVKNQALAGLCWVFGRVILEKVVSPVINMLLKQTIKTIAFPMIMDSTQTSLGIGVQGAHALYNLKVSLNNILLQFIVNASKPKCRYTSVPPEFSKKLNENGSLLFQRLFRVLRLQMSDTSLPQLQHYLSQPEKEGLSEIFKLDKHLDAHLSTLAGCLNDALATDNFLGESLLSSLQSLNISCFTTPPATPPKEDIDASLKSTVEKTIPVLFQTISEVQNTDQANQNAADICILSFKRKTKEFSENCLERSRYSHFSQFVTDFKNFKSEVDRLVDEAKKTMTTQAFNYLRQSLQAPMEYIQNMEKHIGLAEQLTPVYIEHQKNLDQLTLLNTIASKLKSPSPDIIESLELLAELTDGKEKEDLVNSITIIREYLLLVKMGRAKKMQDKMQRTMDFLSEYTTKQIQVFEEKTKTSSELKTIDDLLSSIVSLSQHMNEMGLINCPVPNTLGSLLDSPLSRLLYNRIVPMVFKLAPSITDTKPRVQQYTEHLFTFLSKEYHYQGLVASLLKGLTPNAS